MKDSYCVSGSSPTRGHARIGRNDACPCGSRKKFKKCCRDVATVAKLKVYNKAIREVLVDQFREKYPVDFEHFYRGSAYHEAGHALMQMLFYRNLERVTIIPYFETWEDAQRSIHQLQEGRVDEWSLFGGVCVGIDHDLDEMNDDDRALYFLNQTASLLAGKPSGDIFCTCDKHLGLDDDDQEKTNFLTAKFKAEDKERLVSAVAAVIQRHRPQLDAVVNALMERETLSGAAVMDAMLASGWDPDADADPNQFYDEALGITAEGEAA